MTTIRHLGLWFGILFGASVQSAVELDVSPDPIVLNESCQITFRATGQIDAEPDFTPLAPAFEIIGRNRQTSINWVNGAREQSTSWVLSAMPRQAGTVVIAPITIGGERSVARTLEVVENATPGPDAGADIMLLVEATPDVPYVQQQIIYTVRLLHRIELSSPRFSSLTTSSDAIIKPLGKGRQYVQQRNGRSFEAFEQRYAIFPQKSGELVIHPLVLTTQVVTGKRSFFDPFSRSVTTRRVESDAIRIDVRPIPPAYPRDATWLPATRLRLYEEWEPDVTSTEAGTPMSRTLFLWAEGLTGGQLPEIAFAAPAGVKLYPDQPQNNEQDTASGFTAVMQEKFALIAGEPGVTEFPAIEVPWWNTESDALEVARIAPRRLEIAAAPAAGTTAAPAGRASGVATASPPPAASPSATPWRNVALALGCAWLATLGLWLRSAGQRPRPDPDSSPRVLPAPRAGRALQDVKVACGAGDAGAARKALMAWSIAGAVPAHGGVRSLRDLAQTVSPGLAQEIRALERYLYGSSDGRWDGNALWDALRHYRPAPAAGSAAANDPALPELFRLAGK